MSLPTGPALRPSPPMSNTERQRQFRQRNPGYYKRLHARRKAAVIALGEKLAREKAIAEIIAPPMPLCLPAPEQVTPLWVDQLLREIQSTTVRRAAGATAGKPAR